MTWWHQLRGRIWFDSHTTREAMSALLAKHEPATTPDVTDRIEAERGGPRLTQAGTERHREPVEVVVYNPNEKRIYIVPRKKQERSA